MIVKPFPLAMLVALAAGEAHGYAIEKQIKADVEGALIVNSRAVYRELQRLIKAGWIMAVPDTRPLRYRLTPAGRKILTAEQADALQVYRLLQQRL